MAQHGIREPIAPLRYLHRVSDYHQELQNMDRITIVVDRVSGGYEASIETESGRYIRFSTNEQEAIILLMRRTKIDRESVRVVRTY